MPWIVAITGSTKSLAYTATSCSFSTMSIVVAMRPCLPLATMIGAIVSVLDIIHSCSTIRPAQHADIFPGCQTSVRDVGCPCATQWLRTGAVARRPAMSFVAGVTWSPKAAPAASREQLCCNRRSPCLDPCLDQWCGLLPTAILLASGTTAEPLGCGCCIEQA